VAGIFGSGTADEPVPTRDHTGTIHDDIPDEVPATWGCAKIAEAITEVEESIIQREFIHPGDKGHQRRIDIEKDWLRKLREKYRVDCP
jgi:hypothetical protein